MHKIFSRLLSWLRLPAPDVRCDPLARMSLRDLADLPSQQRPVRCDR